MIRPGDLPEAIREGSRLSQQEGMLSLDEVEKRHIERVLKATAGNKLKAARILGIPRASLYRLIERYGIATAFDKGPREELPEEASHPPEPAGDKK